MNVLIKHALHSNCLSLLWSAYWVRWEQLNAFLNKHSLYLRGLSAFYSIFMFGPFTILNEEVFLGNTIYSRIPCSLFSVLKRTETDVFLKLKMHMPKIQYLLSYITYMIISFSSSDTVFEDSKHNTCMILVIQSHQNII